MIFDDDENLANEEVLYEGKPSFIFSCKSIILGILAISFILGSSLTILSSVSEIQSYSIGFIQQPIDQFIALAIYGIVFIILIWIVIKLLKWYSINYIITNKRIISKTGIIRQNKSYMSFHNIQDIHVSQSIIQKLFGVGTIEIMSAYDNGDVSLKYVHYPKDVEEIIFNGMNDAPSFSPETPRFGPEERYYDNSRYNQEYGPIRHDYNNDYAESYNPNYNGSTIYNESRPNIKDSYIRENYPEYEDDSFYGLSNEPLNTPSDNEIYYNDYQDPDEFDETINQAVRNFDGNIKFKDDNIVNNHRNDSGINYQGRRINKHGYDNKYHRDNYNSQDYQRYSQGYLENQYHSSQMNDMSNVDYNSGYSREENINPRYYENPSSNNPKYPIAEKNNHDDFRYSGGRKFNEYSNRGYSRDGDSNVRYHGYNQSNPRYHGYDDNEFYQENHKINDEHNNHHSSKNRNYDEDIDKNHHEENKSKTRDSVLAKHDRKFKF
ncbi:MAG: PH domain-containing protein [Methanobrevibacter sp.]